MADEAEERLVESPETPVGTTVPRRPARDFSRTVMAHNLPMPTADKNWKEATFQRLLTAKGVAARLHEDPHQPRHRRLIAECPDKGAAETLKGRLDAAFKQLSAHCLDTYLDTLRQGEAATIRLRARADHIARRDQVPNYEPAYDPESFYTQVEVSVHPSSFGDEAQFRRTFEQFGTIVTMEADEPLGGGRTWRITYPFLADAWAAEFAYHEKREDDRRYSVVIQNCQPYDRMLFLMALLPTDQPLQAPGRTSPRAASVVSDGGCRLARRVHMMCRWSCCSGGALPSEPPTPLAEEAGNFPGTSEPPE